MVRHGSSEGNHAWLQGYGPHTDLFVRHTSSHSRPTKNGIMDYDSAMIQVALALGGCICHRTEYWRHADDAGVVVVVEPGERKRNPLPAG